MSKKRQPPGKARTSASSKAARPKWGGASQTAKDRVVRVFVSSTFRDMVEDRNELMTQVWPALRKLCRARNVEFVEVDLRWGVTEEQAQRKETLEHCLAEIRRCRPYFIGLLGERYGWVPGLEAYPTGLLERESWLTKEVAQRSVTELEILHGVLNDPEMAGRAFFYFRDPKYIRTIARARRKDYAAESAESSERQQRLKDRIRATCKAKGIPLRENYAGPRALAKRVLADLTAAIDAEFPADQVPDTWASEDRDHEAYAKSRRTDFYVGRSSDFARLDGYARAGADGRGLVVLGESGGGKSALLANWASQWSQAHPGDFVFQHFIGSSPMSAGHLALMRRLMVVILRWCGEGEASSRRIAKENRIPAEAEKIVKEFPEYLDRLAAEAKRRDVRAIVVLDALNQLDDQDRARWMGWLPNCIPGKVRLIVSTLPGEPLEALEARKWPAMTVRPLTLPERHRLIARYLAHFSQGLSRQRVRQIAEVAAAANPLYIKTLLDDLRATGMHDQLDRQITGYLRAKTLPALFAKILSRYERDYERDRPGLVREALALIWAARRGLTEPELLDLLKWKGQKRLPAAIWSPVRCALEDGLVDRDGILAFAHEHLRKAVERRYVHDDKAARALRLSLVNYFARQSVDARQSDELPWLLRQIGARSRLRECLLDFHWFCLIRQRDEQELHGYWIWLGQERKMGKLYLTAFNRWQRELERKTRNISIMAAELGGYLYDASLYSEAEPFLRRALALATKHYGKDHPNVAICLNNLASLLSHTNRNAEAESLMRRALAIKENAYGKNHLDVSQNLNNLACVLQELKQWSAAKTLLHRALNIAEKSCGVSHAIVGSYLNNLAHILQSTNRREEAEPLLRRALAIATKCYGKDHPEVAICLNNLATLLQETNRLVEAELLLRRALEIDEKAYGKTHVNIALRLNNMVALLVESRRIAEAEPMMRRALQIYCLNLGPSHPETQDATTSYWFILTCLQYPQSKIRKIIKNIDQKLEC